MSDAEWFERNKELVQNVISPELIDDKKRGEELLAKSKRGFLTWADMMNLPHEENNYLIDKFLWEGQVAMILAKEKVGKSILSKQMICALTSGEALFEEYDVSRKCTICYLQLEGDRGETKTRFKSMSSGVPVGEERFFWRFYDRLFLDKDSDADLLINEIFAAGIKPDVIFIDPVYMACSGSLSNDEVVRKMIGNIRRVQETFNCAIVLVHHEHRGIKDQTGKDIEEGDNAIMGSFAFKAFVSHVIRITKPHKDGNTRIIKCDTQRNGNVESNIKIDLHSEPLMYKKQIGKMPKGMGETVYKYIKSKKDGVSVVDFVNSHQTPRSTVSQVIAKLLKEKLIYKAGRKGHGEVVYKAVNSEV